MAYTVNADDPSRPLDTDPRKQGAEELRALKARLIQTRTTLEGADSTNATAAANALAAANAAQSAANSAQSSANAAQGAANAAQSTANNALTLAQAVTFKNCIELTGSGNWTVPDGVTQVLAIIASGGTASGSKEFYSAIALGFPSVNDYYTIDLTSQRIGHNVKRIGVTPAQVISYECGAGDVVRTDYANIGTVGGRSPNILQSVAQSTRFGTHYAHPEVPYIWQGKTSSTIDITNRLRTRQLIADVLVLDYVWVPHTGNWYNGDAGRIMLFY